MLGSEDIVALGILISLYGDTLPCETIKKSINLLKKKLGYAIDNKIRRLNKTWEELLNENPCKKDFGYQLIKAYIYSQRITYPLLFSFLPYDKKKWIIHLKDENINNISTDNLYFQNILTDERIPFEKRSLYTPLGIYIPADKVIDYWSQSIQSLLNEYDFSETNISPHSPYLFEKLEKSSTKRKKLVENLIEFKNTKQKWNELTDLLYAGSRFLSYLYPQSSCPNNLFYYNEEIDTVEVQDPIQFRRCIQKYQRKNTNFFIDVSIQKEGGGAHANILWFDIPNKTIELYEPSIHEIREDIDNAFRDWFETYLPDYNYLGNITPDEYCIQFVRREKRGQRDAFCVDYSTLYILKRIEGLTLQETYKYIQKLIDDDELLLEEIRNLYQRYEDWIQKHLE
jgi:hypothetical protein